MHATHTPSQGHNSTTKDSYQQQAERDAAMYYSEITGGLTDPMDRAGAVYTWMLKREAELRQQAEAAKLVPIPDGGIMNKLGQLSPLGNRPAYDGDDMAARRAEAMRGALQGRIAAQLGDNTDTAEGAAPQ